MTTAKQLDERYGRARKRRLPWIIGAILATALVIAASWMTVARSLDAVDADDLGYKVIDAHSVSVRFQITAPPGRDLICAIEALDQEFGVVGWKIVEIPATDAHMRRFDETVPTVAEATTGLVNGCWVA